VGGAFSFFIIFFPSVGLLPHGFAPSGYSEAYSGLWRSTPAHATFLPMTVKDLISLAAVVVGMLLVLIAN
jgi:hypothetical protein